VDGTVKALFAGTRVDLRGVTVTGPGPGLHAELGAVLVAERIKVVDVQGAGAFTQGTGTRIELRDSSVTRVSPMPSEIRGYGFSVGPGTSLDATRTLVGETTRVGVVVSGAGARARLSACVIRGTRPHLPNADGGRGVAVQSGAQVEVTDSIITDNFEAGASVASQEGGPVARLSLARCIVASTHPRRDQHLGVGLSAQSAGVLQVEQTLIVDNTEEGILAQGENTNVTVAASVVRRTHVGVVVGGNSASATGRGATANTGATLTLTGVRLEDNESGAVLADGAETRVTFDASLASTGAPILNANGVLVRAEAKFYATDSVFDTQSEFLVTARDPGTRVGLTSCVVRGSYAIVGRPGTGLGLIAFNGAFVRGEGLRIAETLHGGVSVQHQGTRVELVRSVVQDVAPTDEVYRGVGIEVNRGATFLGSELRVVDNALSEILVGGEETRLELSRSVVGSTQKGDHYAAEGLEASDHAQVRVDRSLVVGADGYGVIARDEGTLVELNSCVVHGTRPQHDGRGYGLSAGSGATLRATDSLVSRSTQVGVYAQDPATRIELFTSAVRDTRSIEVDGISSNGTFGRGFDLETEATLFARGLLIEHNREVGIYANRSARLDLADLVLLDVSRSERCFGVGIYARGGAALTGDRIAIRSVEGAGLVVATTPEGAMAHARIQDLFVRDVRPGRIVFSTDGMTNRCGGNPVSYGLHAGYACTLDVTHALLDGSEGQGYGFFNANGTVGLHHSVITQQEHAGGRSAETRPEATTLDDVTFVGNVSNALSPETAPPSLEYDRPSPPLSALPGRDR
jgi:hypothetical protein